MSIIMHFIDEIEQIDSSSSLRRNVKAALSRREAEVIVMRRLLNYVRTMKSAWELSLRISSVLDRN